MDTNELVLFIAFLFAPIGIIAFVVTSYLYIKYQLSYRFIDEEYNRDLVLNVQDATRHFRYKPGYEPFAFDSSIGTLILTEQQRLGRSR